MFNGHRLTSISHCLLTHHAGAVKKRFYYIDSLIAVLELPAVRQILKRQNVCAHRFVKVECVKTGTTVVREGGISSALGIDGYDLEIKLIDGRWATLATIHTCATYSNTEE